MSLWATIPLPLGHSLSRESQAQRLWSNGRKIIVFINLRELPKPLNAELKLTTTL